MKGTDMHSVVAKSVGVTRDQAKILNYGRIYGAGVKFAKQQIMNYNANLTEDQAKRLANKMYNETKGEKTYVLNSLGALCLCLSGSGDKHIEKRVMQFYKNNLLCLLNEFLCRHFS